MGYNKKVIMLILDGWGLSPDTKYNAITQAKTPNITRLVREYPNVQLKSDGLSVGLPEGQCGTSEVNHLTLGCGRVIFQDLPKINDSIKTGAFFLNEVLRQNIASAKDKNSSMHVMGILSDGGLHSHNAHLFALLDLLEKEYFTNNIYIHVFTDGRDTPPKVAEKYLSQLDNEIKKRSKLKAKIVTIQGRIFLDRDRDWDKTKKAVDLLLEGKGRSYTGWDKVLNYEYNMDNKDEFINQSIIDPDGIIKSGDSLIFFHYRSDRMYQVLKEILDRKVRDLEIASFISGSEEFDEKVKVAFPRTEVKSTLAETISKAGKTQYHVTETEKFTHLTFFFNAQREKEFPGEVWRQFESNRYVKPYYNFEPTMQVFSITKDIIEKVENDQFDYIVSNLCNCDMVGHTGNLHATIIAAETVDFCVGKIYEVIKDRLDEYALIITADHGNADIMWDKEAKQDHTMHTNSPVPFILVSDIDCTLNRKESLEDVAPTVLDLMGIQIPSIMTGTSLILDKKK